MSKNHHHSTPILEYTSREEKLEYGWKKIVVSLSAAVAIVLGGHFYRNPDATRDFLCEATFEFLCSPNSYELHPKQQKLISTPPQNSGALTE